MLDRQRLAHADTVEETGRLERGMAVWDDDRPSASDLAADAEMDRQHADFQRRMDAVRRERGEYVPSPDTRIAASGAAIVLAQHGIFDVTVNPTREGILWVTAASGRDPLDPVAVQTALSDYDPDRYDFRTVDDGVWVRVVAVADPGPPF